MTTQSTMAIDSGKSHIPALLLSSVFITLILFYLDEGYFDFRWMRDPGNWILFVVYAAVFFFNQFLVSKFLFKRVKGYNNTILSIIAGGLTLAVLILIIAIFTSW